MCTEQLHVPGTSARDSEGDQRIQANEVAIWTSKFTVALRNGQVNK